MVKKNFFWLTLVALIAMLLPVAGAGAASAHEVVTVSPSNMRGWAFFQETPGTASGTMVTGPGVPPLGSGSARLTVDSTAGILLGVAAYGGTYFRDITTLQYSTYRTAGAPALAIALQFNVDYDLTDTNTAWQGRLVYEPYQSGAVVTTGAWQTWNPLLGKWWATKAPYNALCSQASPCTWAQVLANWPNAGISTSDPAVIFKAGGGWTGGFDGNVDAFTIGVKGDTTTYDFEPAGTSKACKDDDAKAESDAAGDDAKDHKNSSACEDHDGDHGKSKDNDHGKNKGGNHKKSSGDDGNGKQDD